MGWKGVILKTDQGRPIEAFAERVKEHRTDETVLESSPKGDPRLKWIGGGGWGKGSGWTG